MKDHKIKAFTYKCGCGYTMSVYIDFGMPQELVKCRFCKKDVKRNID